MNKVILVGRLTEQPELRRTQSGVSVVKFTVAVNRPYNKEREQEADFINCTAWKNTAEFISRYFTKGSAIIVEGSLRNNNYTDKNGTKHYAMDVLVNNVEFNGSKKDGNSNATTTADTSNDFDLDDFAEVISDGDTPF